MLDGKDLIVRLGTGSGKSLCYQIPAVVNAESGRVTIIISPQLTLIEDQSRQLHRLGIAATTIKACSQAKTKK